MHDSCPCVLQVLDHGWLCGGYHYVGCVHSAVCMLCML